jgi:hypothetical protein
MIARVLIALVGGLTAAFVAVQIVAAQTPTQPPPMLPDRHKEAPRHVKTVGPASNTASVEQDAPDIVGGEIAEEGAWPWQVALVQPGQPNAYYGQYCGGSLIAPNWVLTAAHCVDGLPNAPGMLDVLMGQNVLSADNGTRTPVDLIIIHPDYSTFALDADLALLRLASPSDQTTVSLDMPDDENLAEEATMATVIGWGRYIPELPLPSDELRQVELPLVPREICGSDQAWGSLITENMICAGYDEGDRSACYGDSGGPLMVPIENEPGWAQVGIVSWGAAGCTGYQRYNVYTRVSRFISWINDCMADPLSAGCRGEGFVGDEFEPDGDVSLGRTLAVNAEGEHHNFHRPQDNDWFSFEAEAGVPYVIYTYELERRSDTVLWLYDQDRLSLLDYNDDRNSAGAVSDETRYDFVASAILWTAPEDGIYYLLVHPFSTMGYGNQTGYKIRVAELDQNRYLPLMRYWGD